MALCSYCKDHDIRALLQHSFEKGDGWDARLPFHPSVFVIRQGGEQGCELCTFIGDIFMEETAEGRGLWYYDWPKGPVTDEQPRERYGPLVWVRSSPGRVRIWSPERESESIPSTVALLIVTREPGKFIWKM
ncbi:hypothetical protein AB5N19_01894 [Seiridium cardinale]